MIPLNALESGVTIGIGPIMLRMDDVGTASKRHEVYGSTRISVGRVRLRFPGNWLWFKYVPPFKQWGPYRELSAAEWRAILQLLAKRGARLTVAITGAWVEDNGSLTPFPRKFPDAAEVIRDGVGAGLLEVANHGLTHCLLSNHAFRPRAFASNRQYHREFYDFISPEVQEAHIARAQQILSDAFRVDVVTFVPPGNLLQPITVELARRHGLRFLSYRAPTTLDGALPVIGDDSGIVFHDRDVVRGGIAWLRARLEAARSREVLFVRELGERLLRESGRFG